MINRTNAKVSAKLNVAYELRDKYWKIKKLFKENFIARSLRKFFGITVPQIPFLFWFYTDRMVISNLLTNAWFAGLASRCNGNGWEAAFTYIALGTGTNAANVTDTTLQTEITTSGWERANSTASRVTTDVTNDTAQLLNTFAFTGTFAVTESWVLNAASTWTLLARQVFSAINVISGDSLQITWKFDFDQWA